MAREEELSPSTSLLLHHRATTTTSSLCVIVGEISFVQTRQLEMEIEGEKFNWKKRGQRVETKMHNFFFVRFEGEKKEKEGTLTFRFVL
jgi:hypothetical protein